MGINFPTIIQQTCGLTPIKKRHGAINKTEEVGIMLSQLVRKSVFNLCCMKNS